MPSGPTMWLASRRTFKSMGNLLEFMAIGTAVKKLPELAPAVGDAAAAGDHQGQGHVDHER